MSEEVVIVKELGWQAHAPREVVGLAGHVKLAISIPEVARASS